MGFMECQRKCLYLRTYTTQTLLFYSNRAHRFPRLFLSSYFAFCQDMYVGKEHMNVATQDTRFKNELSCMEQA